VTTPISYGNMQQPDNEKPVDIQRILGFARRYWYLLVLFPFLCVSIAYFYTKYAAKQYKITSIILIKQDESKKGSKQGATFDASSLFLGNASNVADEIEILKSRTLMANVLSELNINPSIHAIGRMKNTPYYHNYPIVVDSFSFSEKVLESITNFILEVHIVDNLHFNVKRNDIKVSGQFGIPFKIDSCFFILRKVKDEQQKSFLITFKSIESVSKEYLEKLTVSPIKGAGGTGNSNAVSISLIDELPKRGVDIVTKLIEVYNRFGIEDKNSGDKNALKFIDNRVSLLTGEVNSGEKDIENYKKSQGILADATSGINFTLEKLGVSDNKITELEIKKTVFNSLLESLTKQSNNSEFSLMPANLVENNSSTALQIVEYNKLILERLRLLKFAKKENASVMILETQINNTKAIIQENIDATISNLQKEIDFSLEKFKSENFIADQELLKVPSKERGLLEITRIKNLKESIYLYLLQKREETALSLATTVVNARVLDSAISSSLPIKPNKQQIILSAFLIGLIIPIVIIYVKVLLNNTIEKEDDIRVQTSTPYLGYITMGEDSKTHIVVEKDNRTASAETFRLLRSNLQFMLATSVNKTVMITSSMTGEGKSFVTLNLGVSLALTSKKTIILGFDLRKPKLISYLQNKPSLNKSEKGLTHFLAGDIPIEMIVHQSSVNPFLYYIPSGPIPPNPAELILQEKTDKLFDYLKTEFDFIIIDTPPVGMVVDAILLAKYASTTLYVTRFGVTKKAQLRIVDGLYRDKKLPKPSIVLNAVKSGIGYGYGYGYEYGYGNYGEKNKNKTLWNRLVKKKILAN
jgi:tyrosine-protein kinase Etk/Wzc